MVKSELINRIVAKQENLSRRDVEKSVNSVLECMSAYLGQGGRIEIRGFGSFSLHYREPRKGRNPKTGEEIPISARRVVTFRPGQKLKSRVEDYAGTKS